MLILAVTLLRGTGSVLALNDTTPPVVQSASLSATTVVAGNSITLTAHITDDITGVGNSGPFVYFQGDNAHTLSVYLTRVSGTAQDGMYQGVITAPSTYPSGTYTVSEIRVSDLAANSVDYNACCIPQIPAAANVSFTVTATATATPTTTRTTIAADHNPATLGQSVIFTATVSVPAPGSGTPTVGTTVTFADNGATIGMGTLSASGTATFTTSSLTVGAHPITATFAGNTTFAASTSTALSEQINTLASGTMRVTSYSPPTGPTAGGTVVTIRGVNFGGSTSVTFDTASGTSLTVSNTTTITVTSPAHAAGTIDITVSTNGQTVTFHGYTYLPESGGIVPLPATHAPPGMVGGGVTPMVSPARHDPLGQVTGAPSGGSAPTPNTAPVTTPTATPPPAPQPARR